MSSNTLPYEFWDEDEEKEKNRQRKKIAMEDIELSGEEARYLMDRAVNKAERISKYQDTWIKKNPDGSTEVHRENGIRIDLPESDVQEFTKKIINRNRDLFNRLANL